MTGEVHDLTLYAGCDYVLHIVDAQADAEVPDPGRTLPRPVAYSQNDPRWANEYYSGSYTFARAGCLVCSIAMMASVAYPIASPDPVLVAGGLRAVGALVSGLVSRPARIPQAYKKLSWGGVLHWREVAADMDIVKSEIENYGGCIIEVAWDPFGPTPPGTASNPNQHFVFALAIDDDDVTIIDPWDGATKSLKMSRYALPRNWTAARAIHGARLVRPIFDD